MRSGIDHKKCRMFAPKKPRFYDCLSQLKTQLLQKYIVLYALCTNTMLHICMFLLSPSPRRAWIEIQIEKRLPFKKAVKYLEKQNERPYTLRDYWNDCEKLNLDLKREDILLPSDLAQAHQRTIDALAEARRQKKLEETREAQKKFEKHLKKLERDFAFESGNLLIRPARSHAELIDEGSALHHCVATYAKKHLSGQTVIFFIRKKSEPDKPFYTLEYNPKTESIVQCRGLHNCGKTPEVEAFVDAWSGYIRNKKKKSHAAA